jgi:predicted nucleotidyltransferase
MKMTAEQLGLNDSLLADMLCILKKFPLVTAANVYGSRAKGDHKSYSDIDIALYGPCSVLDAARISDELDELPCALSFDITVYDHIENDEFRAHIDRVGIAVYP